MISTEGRQFEIAIATAVVPSAISNAKQGSFVIGALFTIAMKESLVMSGGTLGAIVDMRAVFEDMGVKRMQMKIFLSRFLMRGDIGLPLVLP